MSTHDSITLEIIQSSLQAIADEMFAALRKTAMSAIIYEVLDAGTGITDAAGNLASSGAGIPGFVGVLDKAVKRIVEIHDKPGDIEPGDVFITNDPVLRRRHPPQRQHPHDAGVCRRQAAGVDGQHRALERCGWHGSGLHLDGCEGDLPGGLAPAGREADLARRADTVGDRHHDGQHPSAEVSARRSVGGCCRRPDRREASSRRSFGNTAPTRSPRRCRASLDYGEQVVLKGLASLPKGRFSMSESQDNGAVYNVAIEITANGVHCRSARQPAPGLRPATTAAATTASARCR